MIKFLRKITKIAGWTSIVTAILLTLLRMGLPLITIPPYFTKWVANKLQYPISIQDIKLSWEGFSPSFELSDVQIFTNDQLRALEIHKLKIRLNLLSLLGQKLVVEELIMNGVVGALDYQQGDVSVKKLPKLNFNLYKNNNKSLDWVPIVKELWLKDSHLEITFNRDNVVCLTNIDVHAELSRVIKVNVLLKSPSGNEVSPQESWQMEFSNKIHPFGFKGKVLAKNIDLTIWQQRVSQGLLWLKPYNIQGQIKNLMGFFDENHGQVILQSDSDQIEYPDFFLQPLLFKEMTLILNWQKDDKKLDLDVKTFQANVLDVPLKGKGKISYIAGTPSLDMILELGKTSTENLLKLFPQKMMKDLGAWLNKAIQGDHVSTICVLRGNLREFPFDQAQGVFEAYSELENLNFNYYPLENPPNWPALTNLKTSLHFHNRSLLISAEKGKLLSGDVIDADALIPDLFVKAPQLIVDAKIASTLSEGLEVVAKSPLPISLIKILTSLSLKGPMLLSLGLEMPLSKKSTGGIQVRGLIEVADAMVSPHGWDYSISNLKGDISFTQNRINSTNLSGSIFGMPSQFTIEKKELGDLLITVTGLLAIEKLQQGLNLELKNIQGTTDYTGTLNILSHDGNLEAALTLTSSLKGLKVDAPYPFAKEKDTAFDSELKFFIEPNHTMRIGAKYGDIHLATQFVLKDFESVGAHLHFGNKETAEFRNDHVFFINGDIDHLDFLTWKRFLFERIPSKNQNKAFTLKPIIELNIGELSLYNLAFNNQKIKARFPSGEDLHVTLEGPSLKGVVKIPENELSPLVVDLQKLAIHSMKNESFSFNQTANTSAINIKIKELIWGNKVISDIQAYLEPSWKGYFFSNAMAKIKENEITISGNWDYLSGQNKVSTTGKIIIKNISETLNALGLKGTVQKGKGSVDFDLNWHGNPSKIDYPTLAGQAEFFLSEGVIQGMNPGIGRVLNLLNLDNVKRRLNLDFSDVTKDGFVFNELNGKFQFGKGKVVSNKVVLQGPSAKIEAFGQADLENQALDGEVIVMPNVTGSLPVAVAIAAGNPVIGAAFWAVDKMFGDKLQEIHQVHYKVLGTWEAPKVEEIGLQVKGLPFESSRGG